MGFPCFINRGGPSIRTYREDLDYGPYSYLCTPPSIDSSIKKIWGEAYGEIPSTMTVTHLFTSFATPEHDMRIDGYTPPGYHQPTAAHGVLSFRRPGRFGIDWPDAVKHPMFYVGVYAAIGFLNAMTNISSTIAQYTGALRAS